MNYSGGCRYLINSFFNSFFGEEGGCYVSDIPDRRDCSVLGETSEEAFAAVLVA